MTSRDKILGAITANKPLLVSIPVINTEQITNYIDPVLKFTASLESIGGKVNEIKDIKQLELVIHNEKAKGLLVVDTINRGTQKVGSINIKQTATELEGVHTAYIKADIGVAENGAVWITELQMINRLLPFICQHLVIVLEKSKIVSTMHHAYQTINSFAEGFAVFIAGPSKTADIEQSLVIGAHGARSLTVYLIS